MSNLTIEKFYGGWSLGSKSGQMGSCRFSQGLNYKEDPDYITANKALVKDSSTVIVDLPKWVTSYNALVYIYGDGGRIYQNSAGTYTVLRTVANSKGQGMAVYGDYLYYRQNSQIGRMKLADSSFTDDWKKGADGIETVTDFAPIKTFMSLLCIANGRYLSTWNDSVFTSQKLGFVKGRHIRDIGVMGEYLVLAVNDNEDITKAKRGFLYFWDGTSSTYNFFTEVLEGGGVSSIQANQEAVYIFTGSGNLYRYNGATNKIKKIPYIGQSSTIYVYPGAETNYKGLCLFGLAGGTSTTVYRGVYSWGQPEIGYPEGLNFEYPISTGLVQGTTVDIGVIQSIGNDLYVGWKSGTTYGIDKLSTTTNQLSVSYESLVVTTTNPNAITREKLYFKPLASGESITVYIKINQATSWTEIGSASYASDGAVTVKLLNYEFRCDDLEIKLVLTGTSTMPSVSKIVFEYEEEGNL
jgi:hypothetical protein